ncbi:endonuclease V [Methylobacter sp. BBA5.1]|uniref:endonuclease V n=1 Tax=Methylobacter sp. BBA5.1 TaxID=1495064 RepID=UPI000568C77B|nr:endonuclease V [Methylobacter sp. BBA5.1]
MLLAVDVDYRDAHAFIAGIAFENWQDASEQNVFRSQLGNIKAYRPGQFYRRELPCILKLIEEHQIVPDAIIIDGFVYLDGKSRPGLGKYLYDALQEKISVLGVAKKPFRGIARECELYRGASKKPLYVTSAGMPLTDAKQHIRSMHGPYRIPTLLKKVDQLCKTMP